MTETQEARAHGRVREGERDDGGERRDSAVRWGDRGLARGPLHGIVVYVCRVLATTLFEIRIFGVGRLGDRGAALLAANHQSLLDPVLVGISHDRSCGFLAKDSLFRVPFLGWLISRLRSFPIPRESVGSRRSLRLCLDILEGGHALIFFPEGTRSNDGRLQSLRRGVGLIAKRALSPVVPILIRGSFAAWRRGELLPRPARVEVHVGTALGFIENESSDSLVDRLAESLRRLAIEAGARELVGDGSWVEGGASEVKEAASPFESVRGACGPSEPAGELSLSSCTAAIHDGELCPAEGR